MRVQQEERIEAMDADEPIDVPATPPAAKRLRRSEPDHRISDQPAFVLHRYLYKETSLIVEVFTRDHGRVALVAKGAKRAHSRLRGVLHTFQPLMVGWSGKSELRNLIAAEWVGGLVPLENSALLYGFYLNELLLKLLAREDPHPALFDHYVETLTQLSNTDAAPIVLRKFELALLKETGVAADLSTCIMSGQPVDPDGIYVVEPEAGPRPAHMGDVAPRVSGKTLADMAREDYTDVATQVQSKLLMRYLLSYHLGGEQIKTRQILIDLMQL